MKKLIKFLILIGSIAVLFIVVIGLTEANAKIFNAITDTGYFPASINKWIPLIKSIGYSFGTIIIVIYYKSYRIKLSFIILDVMIIWVFYFFNYDNWKDLAGFIYPLYTGLMFGFIGNIIFEFFTNDDIEIVDITEYNSLVRENEELSDNIYNLKNDLDNIKNQSDEYKLKYTSMKYSQDILNLKRTNRGHKKWNEIPEIVNEIKEKEEYLKNINKQLELFN